MSDSMPNADTKGWNRSLRRLLPDFHQLKNPVLLYMVRARILALMIFLTMPIPTTTLWADDSILQFLPSILSGINSQQLNPPAQDYSTDCNYDDGSKGLCTIGAYCMWCVMKRPDGTISHKESFVFSAGNNSEQTIRHYYYSPTDEIYEHSLAQNEFEYKAKDADLWHNIDWSVRLAITDALPTPTSSEPLNQYSCHLLTPGGFGDKNVVVTLYEWMNEVKVKEWPVVTCEGNPFSLCAEKIKSLGYMDQCQQDVLDQHQYSSLKSFPGTCSEVWNHRDENGVLQKCGL